MTALQIPTYTDASTWVVVPNAYVRINGITIDNTALTIMISAALYPTKAAFDGGAHPTVVATFPVPAGSYAGIVNPLLALAYPYLKTLAPFAGAIDVA
jgi:hypothetical protein